MAESLSESLVKAREEGHGGRLVHLLGSLGGLATEDNGLGTMSWALGSFCLLCSHFWVCFTMLSLYSK
jgi:hypothetical protein